MEKETTSFCTKGTGLVANRGMEEETTLFDNAVNNTRKRIKHVAAYVDTLKKNITGIEAKANENRGEVMANLTLTYRHLEDASMRLGKVLQAYDGGISVYDKDTTVGA